MTLYIHVHVGTLIHNIFTNATVKLLPLITSYFHEATVNYLILNENIDSQLYLGFKILLVFISLETGPLVCLSYLKLMIWAEYHLTNLRTLYIRNQNHTIVAGVLFQWVYLGRNRVKACRSQLSSTPMLTAQEKLHSIVRRFGRS